MFQHFLLLTKYSINFNKKPWPPPLFKETRAFYLSNKKPATSHLAKKRGKFLQAGILTSGTLLLKEFPTLHPFPQ